MRKLLIGMMLLLAGASGVYAQDVVIGKPLPEITLRLILPEVKILTTQSLKGKPVMLCFISKGCMGAWHFLRDAAPVYEKYKDRMHMIIIPIDDTDNDRVMEVYALYQKAYGLTFPVAEDRNKVLHDQLGVSAMPHLLWIDAAGKVAAISFTLDNAEIEKFVNDETLNIPDPHNQRADTRKFDRKKPLLVNGNGGEDTAFFQRSVFARWKPGMPNTTLSSDYTYSGDPFVNLDMLQVSGRRLKELYRIAYIGKSKAWQANDTTMHGIFRYQPILEVADSSLFEENQLTGANLFCYSQVLPRSKRTREIMMHVMQADLKNCFGYDVTLETRRTPYWRLVAGKHAAKLLTAKPGESSGSWDMMSGGKLYGHPISTLVEVINYAGELIINDRPLIDETGITNRIDIELYAAMNNLEDVKRALKAYDLYLVPGEREMKVIVIRDPVNSN